MLITYFIICSAALFASILTLVAGFGLGTLLMPVFAIFFPLEVAIAATAIVHFINNITKLILVGKFTKWSVLGPFLLGAIPAALLGAFLLHVLGSADVLHQYSIGSVTGRITLVKIAVGAALIGFAAIEFWPRFDKLAFERKWLAVGGAISGFFGGLTGMQGALRAAFLVRCGLTKRELVGTGSTASAFIDATRLLFYFIAAWSARNEAFDLGEGRVGVIIAASLTACAGSILGAQLIEKVTFAAVKVTVACCLAIVGLLLIAGLTGA